MQAPNTKQPTFIHKCEKCHRSVIVTVNIQVTCTFCALDMPIVQRASNSFPKNLGINSAQNPTKSALIGKFQESNHILEVIS